MNVVRRTAAATAVLALLLTGCMDEGPNVPDPGDQESPAPAALER